MLERADDAALRRLVDTALGNELGDGEVADLAEGLAASGWPDPLRSVRLV